jgi:hypothetical protein
MSLSRQYSFWGSLSPLGGLTGAGLLIMASARLSWAITVAGSLFWVYGLTAFTFSFLLKAFGNKFFPVKGRISLYTCIAAFFGSVYLLMLWLLSPFAALEVFLLLLLVPLFFAGSGVVQQISSQSENYQIDIFEYVSDVVSQAVHLAGLLIAFSIVREPLSYSSLTFPGTYQGMMTIMHFNENSFFPINIFASSAGALLLLGYIICLYQYGKDRINPGEI